MKKIEDYLHLYLGCEMWPYIPSIFGSHDQTKYKSYTLTSKNLGRSIEDEDLLILRPLSDITKEEGEELRKKFSHAVRIHNLLDVPLNCGEYTLWLLSKGFDLFGLIEAELAIDKTKL